MSSTSSPIPMTSVDREQLRIDVWSDLACPWCYLGKHWLDHAIATSPHSAAITVERSSGSRGGRRACAAPG
jgi:hypothetical protein